MALKKVKMIIAQFLVVALLVPKINVQALENTTSSQEKNNIEIKTINSEDETEVNLESENSLNINNETKINEENQSTEEKTSTVESLDTNNLENTDVGQVEEKVSTETNIEEKLKDDSREAVSQGTTPKNGTVYNKRKAVNNNVKSFAMEPQISELDEELRERYELKRQAFEEREVLEPLTDKAYELTIANFDGSYEFVDAYDNYDEAVNSAKVLNENLDDTKEPVVINYAGEAVYSANQMAKVRYISTIVKIFDDSNLSKWNMSYFNPICLEDIPVLDTTSTSVKVMVNGKIGWISNEYITYIPVAQATNPSYYTVKNGELVHFLSYDIERTSGYNIVLGKAPSYLKEGVKYLSYDEKYFYQYDAGNLSSKLNILTNDYITGVRTNSINNPNPFYLYYQNLPFRSKTVYTAAELDNYINYAIATRGTPDSKLRGIGQALKNAEASYGVNAVLMLSVAINESNFGNSAIATTKNNLFGMAAYDTNTEAAKSYATPGDSILDFSKNYISDDYADPAGTNYYGGFLGNKNRGANLRYASDPFWGEIAAQHAYSIDKYLSGGNGNLRDTNSNQIGIATTNNRVITSSGAELYKVSSSLNDYAFYTETPFVISNFVTTNVAGVNSYEINPEITNPLFTNGKLNDFLGDYNWNQKGYISTSGVKLVNTFVPQVEVKYGISRYETAVEVSKSSFTSADTVVITNGYAIIDGVSATPLAAKINAPLLLSDTDRMSNSVKAEIKRLGAKNAIIVGGSGVVTTNVENELKSIGITKITRLGGLSRYDTSLQVAKYMDQNVSDVENVVIASGNGEADALSVSSVAGNQNMPILLVEQYGIPSDVLAWLKSESLDNAYVVGGTGIISDSVLNTLNSITKQDIRNNRLGGIDRYETNAKIIERFYGNAVDKAYITVGDPLADSLSAGVVAALNNSPVILADTNLTSVQRNVLGKKTANKIVQVGGTVSGSAVNTLKELLSRTQ